MATKVTIIYTGLIVDEIRQGMSIPRYFEPRNSYVDSPVYTEGFENKDGLGDGESYGKSIYATNVDGWKYFPGLLPMYSNTTKFAQFERAIIAEFEIEGYEEEIYWCQICNSMADQGFYSKVGDEEFGTPPEESDGDGEDPNP